MIIFGTSGITYNKDTSEFFCPSCAATQPYKHKRVRRFFTLYFIPMIPLDLVGEYVECQQCRGTFRLEVLDYDSESVAEEFEAEFHIAVRCVMVRMMLADGAIDDKEVEIIRQIYGQLTNRDIPPAAVLAEAESASADQRGVEAFLSPIAGNLNDEGKEMVVQGAFLVAAADGEFHDDEKTLLASIGHALGMSDAHLHGVISSMMQAEA